MRVVAGFLGATSGTIKLGGYDLAEAPVSARQQVGYMPEAVPLYPELRVREYLAYRAQPKRRRDDSARGRLVGPWNARTSPT